MASLPKRETEPTLEDAIAELNRELRLRKALYPKWVKQGKLEKIDADWQIKCLEVAINLLKS